MRVKRAFRAVVGLAVGALAAPCWAETPSFDLALVLAVDVSGSMTPQELAMQRQGYVTALRGTGIGAAAGAGPLGRIALTYLEWADPNLQTVVVPWRVIASDADAAAFAAELERAPAQSGTNTSISAGLVASARLFADLPAPAERWLVDISGDGVNTAGAHVAPTRDRLLARGIVVNGLPILTDGTVTDEVNGIDLKAYYRDCVIGGAGAFVLPVAGLDGIADAIARKMVREIAGPGLPEIPQVVPVAASAGADCTAGQKDFYE
jgi:hypothetical protein